MCKVWHKKSNSDGFMFDVFMMPCFDKHVLYMTICFQFKFPLLEPVFASILLSSALVCTEFSQNFEFFVHSSLSASDWPLCRLGAESHLALP